MKKKTACKTPLKKIFFRGAAVNCGEKKEKVMTDFHMCVWYIERQYAAFDMWYKSNNEIRQRTGCRCPAHITDMKECDIEPFKQKADKKMQFLMTRVQENKDAILADKVAAALIQVQFKQDMEIWNNIRILQREMNLCFRDVAASCFDLLLEDTHPASILLKIQLNLELTDRKFDDGIDSAIIRMRMHYFKSRFAYTCDGLLGRALQETNAVVSVRYAATVLDVAFGNVTVSFQGNEHLIGYMFPLQSSHLTMEHNSYNSYVFSEYEPLRVHAKQEFYEQIYSCIQRGAHS